MHLHITSSPYPYPKQISEGNSRQLNSPSIKAQQPSNPPGAVKPHKAEELLLKESASKNQILLNLLACWEPVTSSPPEYTDDRTTIESATSSEPSSHTIKLQFQELWRAYSSESWDEILPEHTMVKHFSQ
jgi:hypothetical protein